MKISTKTETVVVVEMTEEDARSLWVFLEAATFLDEVPVEFDLAAHEGLFHGLKELLS